MKHYHAGYNMPGYLPESEFGFGTYATWDEAKASMLWELNFHADNVGSWADPHDCDDVPCPTYGDDCPHDKANALSLTAKDLNLVNEPSGDYEVDEFAAAWQEIAAGMAYWIHGCHDEGCIEDCEAEDAE